MKKLFYLLLIFYAGSITAQQASKVNNAQNTYASGQPRVILSCDTLPSGLFRLYPKAQLTWKWSQITDRANTLSGYGITDGVPSNRTINGYNLTTDVTLSKVDVSLGNVDNTSDLNKPVSTATQTALNNKFNNPSGTIAQYLRGDGTTATFPTIPTLTSQLTNDSGFLTSVPAQSFSSLTGKPTTLSGYGITDAYPLTGNPSNFLTSINSGQVTTALGYTPVNPNGNNLQYIAGDGSKITFPSIPTNTNQLTNGAGFITNLSSFNTGNLAEGSNLYWTTARFNSAFSAKTTTDLSEGTNLYFNNSRARNAISAGTGISYDSSTGVITNTVGVPTPNVATRTLNSNYTINTTKQAFATYSITCSVTNPLLAGTSAANVFLEYSLNAGSSWILVSQNGNSSGVGLAVAVAITNTQTVSVNGYIPANALVRLRTTTSGTASVTYVSGQETY